MAEPIKTTQAADNQGWILYDAQCGICRTWVPRWQATLQRAGFGVAPLQSEWVAERTQLTEEELLSDFRLLLPDDSLVNGADAYRVILRQIWWAWPLAMIASIWPLSMLVNSLYRRIADNRHRLSKACRL